MRKIRVAALLALAALTAGCAQSKVPAGAAVTLTGQVVRQNGEPAANLRLALIRVPDLGEVAAQGLMVVGTLGTACLADNPPQVCKILRTVNSDGQGRFTVHMSGSDVRGSFNTATNFGLSAQLPATGDEVGGPTVQTNFLIQRTDLAVPALKFWEPQHVTAVGDAAKTTVGWDPLAGASGYTVHFAKDYQDVWATDGAPGSTVDARAFEDVNGVIRVSTTGSAAGPDTSFDTTYTSQGIPFTGRAGRPESRAAACYTDGPDGKPTPVSPCVLTDGSFEHPLIQPECPSNDCTAATEHWVYLDLGRPQQIGAVFARGVSPGQPVAIETSDDAHTWSPRGSGAGRFMKVSLLETVTARYVRLRASSLAGLTQVSVWPTA